MTDEQARMLLNECRDVAKANARSSDDWESIASDVWCELWQRDIITCDVTLTKQKLRCSRTGVIRQYLGDINELSSKTFAIASSQISCSCSFTQLELRVWALIQKGHTRERIRSELGMSRDHLSEVIVRVLARVRKDVESERL